MQRVSVEDVEQDPNGYMMRVMAGEEFEVTRNGQVFATMRPPSKKRR
jgi:antitoxin (DNA-binding transcriptional repressor) of toxin-antitoxin stability system